jgi:hypothetical protein
MTRRLITLAALLCALAPVWSLANDPCRDADHVIDNRDEPQAETDREDTKLRCVKFVLSRWEGEYTFGWVEWHAMESAGHSISHRLGMFPAAVGWKMVFGRLPGRVEAGPETASASVLLDRPRWWLVNATRHGWQLRSGTIGNPDMQTLRKLFTDVALNAGIAETGEALEDWWPGRL